MISFGRCVLVLMICCCLARRGKAEPSEVSVCGMFSDGMVLPRQMPVPVWGKARPGSAVEVAFAGQVVQTRADADGTWRVVLSPLETESCGRDLRIGTRVIRDVLVGDVWLCAGQSNMQFPLCGTNGWQHAFNGNAFVQVVHEPQIRFASPRRMYCAVPTNEIALVWRKGNADGLKASLYEGNHEEGSISALGWHFAKYVHDATRIPIGFVDVSRGGAFIEPCLAPAEARQIKELKLHLYGEHQRPGVLWNAMIHPMRTFPFKGVLWYQGESNKCCTNGEYLAKFRALTAGWRREFGNPCLPFYYVQIAPNQVGHLSVQLQQAEYEREDSHSSMVVSFDVGSAHQLHPRDKQTIGLRLALKALRNQYGFAWVKADSPYAVEARAGGDACVEVAFKNAEWMAVVTEDGRHRVDFELLDQNGQWKSAEIANLKKEWVWYKKKTVDSDLVDGSVIKLRTEGLVNPCAVRYGFTNPWEGGVYNEVDLPLGPFQLPVKGYSDENQTAPIPDL